MQSLSEAIYTLLVHRRFRTGPLPAPAVNERIHLKIDKACKRNAPVPIFLFWGGAKNPNLPITHADHCEQITLDYLQQLHQEISKLYSPGLQFFIFPGDARVHYANHIPASATSHYVETLSQICARYGELFTLVPVSRLYTQSAEAFQACLAEAQKQLCQESMTKHPLFNTLVTHARKNIFTGDLSSEAEKAERSQDAALRYIHYRLAEEKAMLYQDFEPCIRASFIKLSLFFSFYAPYLELAMTTPRLDASLHFYAGKKGNITQPWQAVAFPKEQQVLFLSQSQLLIPPYESTPVS